MVIQKGSNKLYPSIVLHHQAILEYSIINQQINHSFEVDTI